MFQATLSLIKLQPAIFLCLNTSFVFTNYSLYQPGQYNASYNRAFIFDWSLSGVMTSKLFIRESESPRPAASSILISRMTSSSVIIPYINKHIFALATRKCSIVAESHIRSHNRVSFNMKFL